MIDFYRHTKVFLALLLAGTILVSMCGCEFFYSEEELSDILGAEDPSQENAPSDTEDSLFSLAYYTEEALDPFTASSRTNSELLHLCYSGLYAVDSTYASQPVLAEGCEIEGNTVRIHLKSEIRFSDGTEVTAADCVASFDRAAQKDSLWKHCFSYIRSYKALDENTFQVVFHAFYPTQLNLLTIPIVKAQSLNDGGTPVGCGRYRLSSDHGLELLRTDCGLFSGNYDVEKISLLGIADREALIYNFNYGRLKAICVDPSSGADEYRSDSEFVTVPTNRISFLVVNKTNPALANVQFSKGLTYLIDRNDLVSRACGSFATPVWYPLNPVWSKTKEATLNPDIYSIAAATEALSAAGFRLDGEVQTFNGKPVTLRILVNRENKSRVKAAEAIATALRSVGFTAEVVQATWDEYRIAVETLDFDLYLGEINLSSNLDLSALYSLENCNTGLMNDEATERLATLSQDLLTGDVDARTYVNAFQEAMPLIPLYYAQDALAIGMEIDGTFGNSTSELYWGIENWYFS